MAQVKQAEVISLDTGQQLVEVKTRPEVLSCLSEMSNTAQALRAFNSIKNEEEKMVVEDLIAKAKGLAKQYDQIRTSIVAPFNEFVKAVNNFFNPTKDKLLKLAREKEGLISFYNAKLLEKQKKREEKLRKEQERIEKKLEKAGLDAEMISTVAVPAPKVDTTTRGASSTSFERREWTFEVLDPFKLMKAVLDRKAPPELVQVNEKAIRGLVNAGIRELPGVKIYQTIKTTVRGR